MRTILLPDSRHIGKYFPLNNRVYKVKTRNLILKSRKQSKGIRAVSRKKLALHALRCQTDLQRKKLGLKFKQMKNEKLMESDYWADDADGIAESTYCPSEYNKSSPFLDRPIPKYNLRSLKANLKSLEQK
jgi:hypothetical protein